MKPQIDKKLRQLLETLTPRQRTIDFAGPRPWEQLPAADRWACSAAIAALLYQVIMTQENERHE